MSVIKLESLLSFLCTYIPDIFALDKIFIFIFIHSYIKSHTSSTLVELCETSYIFYI